MTKQKTMKKSTKVIYYVVTAIITLGFLPAAGMYIFNHEEVSTVFAGLGMPVGLIYPLAAAKLLGLIAIWTNKSRLLKELAYAGFAIDLCAASAAHYFAGDAIDAVISPLVMLVFVSLSFIYHRKVFVQGSQAAA